GRVAGLGPIVGVVAAAGRAEDEQEHEEEGEGAGSTVHGGLRSVGFGVETHEALVRLTRMGSGGGGQRVPMDQLHLAYAVVGLAAVFLVLASARIAAWPVTEPMVALGVGVVL